MGMQAVIIAIGNFSKDIIDYLEYPNEFYSNVIDDAIITERLFGMLGSISSRKFAQLLGISDPWDFNQHKLNINNINLDELKFFATQFEPDYLDDYEKLLKLIEHGFEFHFRPEG